MNVHMYKRNYKNLKTFFKNIFSVFIEPHSVLGPAIHLTFREFVGNSC